LFVKILGFVGLAWPGWRWWRSCWVSPEILDRSLRRVSQRRMVNLGVLVALSGLLALLGLAVLRRRCWAF
jgi:threonine/homoserine/homoserine lactone efflux protein